MRTILAIECWLFIFVLVALLVNSWPESPPVAPKGSAAVQEERVITVLVPAYGGTPLKAVATAYCPCELCCGEFADGKTSIGDDAFVIDGIAADPRAIPYRTRVSIPGIGVREVDDTGGIMQRAWRERGEYHIDLRFATHEEALEWGRKTVTITILPR